MCLILGKHYPNEWGSFHFSRCLKKKRKKEEVNNNNNKILFFDFIFNLKVSLYPMGHTFYLNVVSSKDPVRFKKDS